MLDKIVEELDYEQKNRLEQCSKRPFPLVRANYSATTLSATAESATTESTTAVSESALATGSAVLLPQDAKEIAAIATNIKTNFFIFFAF